MSARHASTLLAALVQQFFTERLMAQRNMSPRTVAAYRDTFRLLLAWFEQKLHKAPSRLALTDLDVAGQHERRLHERACGLDCAESGRLLTHTIGHQEPGLHDFVDTSLIPGNVYLLAAAHGLASWFL
jgi:hypothetical protein